MSITSISGVLNGILPPVFFTKQITSTTTAGRSYSTWGYTGFPTAGSQNATLAGATLSSTSSQVTGQLPFFNPVSGSSYVAKLQAGASGTGVLILADRLWSNGGFTITSTSAQTVNSVTWPARDENASTNGVGVLIGVEVSAATGSGTPTLTMSYTNSSGTSGRTATNILATAASSIAGSFYPLGLQSGDVGVRSIQTFTLSATWTSGTINLVAYRILCVLDVSRTAVSFSTDAANNGFSKIIDGSVPFLIYNTASAITGSISGNVSWAQG